MMFWNSHLFFAFIPDPSFSVLFGTLALGAVGLWFLRKKIAAGVIGLFGLVLFTMIIVPDTRGAKAATEQSFCIANLQQIKGAKAVWSKEHHKSATAVPTEADLFGSAGYLPAKPACPRGGSYTVGAVGKQPTCSFAASGHVLPARRGNRPN